MMNRFGAGILGLTFLQTACNPNLENQLGSKEICQKEVTRLLDAARVDVAPEVEVELDERICDSQQKIDKVVNIKSMGKEECRLAVQETIGAVVKNELDSLKSRICNGSHNNPILTIDFDGDGHTGEDDCDDTKAQVYKDATELCDGVDDDCDGRHTTNNYHGGWPAGLEYHEGTPYYLDEDGDEYPGQQSAPTNLKDYCNPENEGGDLVMFEGKQYSIFNKDCDDKDSATNTNQSENPLIRDGLDNDCDAVTDFGVPKAPEELSGIIIYQESLSSEVVGKDPNCKWVHTGRYGVKLKDPSDKNVLTCYPEEDRGGIEELTSVLMATEWFYHGRDANPIDSFNDNITSTTNLCAQAWTQDSFRDVKGDEWKGCEVDEIEKLIGDILSSETKAKAFYPMIKAGILAHNEHGYKVSIEDLEYMADYLRSYDLKAETNFRETGCLDLSSEVAMEMNCDGSIPEGYDRIEWEKLKAQAKQDAHFEMPSPGQQSHYSDFLFAHLKNGHFTAKELLPWVERMIKDLKGTESTK